MGWFQHILNFDTDLFLYLNSFHNNFWDTIMLMVTRKETWLPFFLVIIFYFIKNYRSKALLILILLAVAILASDQISVLIKESVQRLRPVHEPALKNLTHNVLRKGGLHGFVSSHAANAFAIFIFTTLVFKNKGYWALMCFWALIFCYSRIYAGVHYPFDIIGGAILGSFIGWGFYRLLMFFESRFFLARNPKIEKTNLETAQFGIILLVFVVLVTTVFIAVYLLHHYNYL